MNHKSWEDLTIADDFMFGKVMTIPSICKETLERILNIQIERIEYSERQKTINTDYEAKGVRMDVYVRDGKGTVTNDDFVRKLDDAVKTARLNSEWRREYMQRLAFIHDIRTEARKEARAEALVEGRQEGRLLTEISLVRNMIGKGFSTEDAAALLAKSVDSVVEIKSTIENNPEFTDEEICELLMPSKENIIEE